MVFRGQLQPNSSMEYLQRHNALELQLDRMIPTEQTSVSRKACAWVLAYIASTIRVPPIDPLRVEVRKSLSRVRSSKRVTI